MFRCAVLNAVERASVQDFDFDVKRKCVAFWAAAAASSGRFGDRRATNGGETEEDEGLEGKRRRKSDRDEGSEGKRLKENDPDDGPEGKRQKKNDRDDFIAVLLAMAKTDDDVSVKRCAKEALETLVSR